MELRFLHGDFGNIKYKLQFRDIKIGDIKSCDWKDVPVVEQTQKPECVHDWSPWIHQPDGSEYRECSKCYNEELTCEHSWDEPNSINKDIRQCTKCGKFKTSAKKNGLEQYLAMSYCAKTNATKPLDAEIIKCMADNARIWAVEVVEKYFEDEIKLPATVQMICEELPERFKDEK